MLAEDSVVHEDQAAVGRRDNYLMAFRAFLVGIVGAVDQSFDVLVVQQDIEKVLSLILVGVQAPIRRLFLPLPEYAELL